MSAEDSIPIQPSGTLSAEDSIPIQPSGTLSAEDSIPIQPSGTLLPEAGIQSGAGPFSVSGVPTKNPTYHKNSVSLYFGSKTDVKWDPILQHSVFSSGMTKEEIVFSSRCIVDQYGCDLFITSVKSDTIEEFHELVQLQFKLKGVMSGPVGKNAMVPISSLVDFSNKLSGTVAEVPTPDDVPLAEKIDDKMIDEDIKTIEASTISEPGVPEQVENQEKSKQVKQSVNEAMQNVIDAYRSKGSDRYGQPFNNQDLVQSTKIHHFNQVGPNSMKDPGNLYSPAFAMNIKPKIPKRKKEKC